MHIHIFRQMYVKIYRYFDYLVAQLKHLKDQQFVFASTRSIAVMILLDLR